MRNEFVEAGDFISTDYIRNPGSYLFFHLVKEVVKELNYRSIENLNLSSMSLIMCEFLPYGNRAWGLLHWIWRPAQYSQTTEKILLLKRSRLCA